MQKIRFMCGKVWHYVKPEDFKNVIESMGGVYDNKSHTVTFTWVEHYKDTECSAYKKMEEEIESVLKLSPIIWEAICEGKSFHGTVNAFEVRKIIYEKYKRFFTKRRTHTFTSPVEIVKYKRTFTLDNLCD